MKRGTKVCRINAPNAAGIYSWRWGDFEIINIASAVSGPGFFATVQSADGCVLHGYVYERHEA